MLLPNRPIQAGLPLACMRCRHCHLARGAPHPTGLARGARLVCLGLPARRREGCRDDRNSQGWAGGMAGLPALAC